MKSTAALVIAGILFTGCSRKPDNSAVAGKLSGQNLLLITLDTTRADRLGCYGYKPAATPALDALAARGVLFENALAQVPLTLPSHCSILTGRYPREHGVRDNGANALGPSHPTLAGIFKEHGYKTGAFVSTFVLDSRFGLERGFDTYSDDMGETGYKIQPLEWQQPANTISDRALAWLEAEKKNPFFCWVHYYDPHQPYVPPQHVMKPELEPYDGELAFVDTQVKRIMDWLQASKLTERTLVVVVGDHGEAFGEHGESGHSHFVYNENLHVPMFFAHPTVIPSGKRVPAITEALDVFPTVLGLFGFKSPEGLMSRSLTAGLAGGKLEDAVAYAESLFVFNSFGWAEQRALTTTRWKYVSSVKPQLFDRIADPRERESVLASQPKVGAKLLADLKARYESMPPGQAAVAELDQAARTALQGLGYVGGGSTKSKDEFLTEGLPDPKDHLELIQKFKVVQTIMESADSPLKTALALPLLQSIVEESPNSRGFQFMLGVHSLQAGQHLQAVDAFRAAIALDPEGTSPQNAQALGLMADTLLRLNRSEEALKHYALAVEVDDLNPDLHFRYAQLLRRAGRPDEAFPHYERALKLFPAYAAARAGYATALKQAGRLEEATRQLDQSMAELKKAIERTPDDADVHYWLADVYVQAGRGSDAIIHFREAHRLKPTRKDVLLDFSALLEARGEIKEAEELLRKATAMEEVAAEAHEALGALYGRQGRPVEGVEQYEKCIALWPDNAVVIQELTGYYMGTGRSKDAIRILKIGVETMPDNVTFLNMLAKPLATSGDAKLRDGAAAVTLATKASQLTQDREPSILATLAAAYAESGDFARAVEIARKAVKLAQEAQQSELAAAILSQLDGYLKNQPYRDSRW